MKISGLPWLVKDMMSRLSRVVPASEQQGVSRSALRFNGDHPLCQKNYHSTWVTSGGYEPMSPTLLARNVSAFYLKFDTERAEDFFTLTPCTCQQTSGTGIVFFQNR